MAPAKRKKNMGPVFAPTPEDPGIDAIRGADYADRDLQERARRAVKAMDKELVALKPLARALTGDPNMNIVQKGTVPCTDGKVIYMRAPIELGDEHRHEQRVCGERDESGVQKCPACLHHEETFITICHEIGHISQGSFEVVSDLDKRELLDRALVENASARAARLKTQLDGIENYMQAAGAVSPALPMLVNALEDARVNRAMYEARPGLLPMFKAHSTHIFENGFTGPDGQPFKWSEAKPNAQAVVGLFARLSGFGYKDWFSPEVVEMLDDPELLPLMMKFNTARSAKAVYRMAFPFLEHLRKHGFCKKKDEQEQETKFGETSEEQDPEGKPQQQEQQPEQQQPEQQQEFEPSGPSMPEDGDPEPESKPQQSEQQESEPGDEPEQDAEAGETDSEPEQDDDGKSTGESDQADDDASGAAEGDDDEPADTEDASGDGSDESDDDGDADSEAGDGDADSDDGDDQENVDGSGFSGEGGDGGSESEDGDDGDGEPTDEWSDMGDPDDIEEALEQFGGHKPGGVGGNGPLSDQDVDPEVARELDRAIVQGEHFDSPSENVFGVNEHRWDRHVEYRTGHYGTTRDRTELMAWRTEPYIVEASRIEDQAPEGILAPTLLRMRTVFADNRKARKTRNLRSGKINSRVLGRRAALGDDRLFQKKREPGERDYFVVIGLDVSGSTSHGKIIQIKEAALAQADLLSRLGVDFAVYAHTAAVHTSVEEMASGHVMDVDIFCIKEPHEKWSSKTRARLHALTWSHYNLDGHTLEYYRKVCDRSNATDKVIMYYTDGAMPASNKAEEAVILERECNLVAQKGYTLMGVGIGTDSPTKYGMPTCVVNGPEDIPEVVKFLGHRLSQKREV